MPRVSLELDGKKRVISLGENTALAALMAARAQAAALTTFIRGEIGGAFERDPIDGDYLVDAYNARALNVDTVVAQRLSGTGPFQFSFISDNGDVIYGPQVINTATAVLTATVVLAAGVTVFLRIENADPSITEIAVKMLGTYA